jgi:DNA-binding SARP family transcriptional activator
MMLAPHSQRRISLPDPPLASTPSVDMTASLHKSVAFPFGRRFRIVSGVHTERGGETRIQLCGRLKADVEGKHVTPALRGRQGRVLLAYLVLNRGRPVSRDELMAALWPKLPPADPSAALRTQLSRLRSALGTSALAGRDTVELRLPDSTWVDVEAAEHAIRDANAALAASEWREAWAHGNVALNISSRPFLAGFDAAWVEEVRRELAELQSRARESIARAGIGLGGSELAGAERSARELVRTSPFRESAYLLLMRALVASGNTAEALRTYERLRRVLREELGTAPGVEIQALHRRLLSGAGGGDGGGEQLRSAPAATAEPAPAAELPLPTWLVPANRSPFVGRTGELGRLEDMWEEAAAGQPQMVLVGGDPGMGKTRLATEFAQRVHDSAGARVLYGRADEHGTRSYQPFVEALRHWAVNTPIEELESSRSLERHAPVLARLVPEIAVRLRQPPAKEPGEPSRDSLFDAVAATLAEIAASRPTLLVIDDLHWADQGTLLLFRRLARSPHRSRLMVLATFRETEPSDTLSETLADLGRERLFGRLRLGGLGPNETAGLVESIQSRSSPELEQAVHAETGGNPFLVEALVQHLVEHGEAPEQPGDAGGRLARRAIYAGGVPSLVREAVAHRASELGAEVKGVLEVASVVGRESETELLTEVSDLPSDSVVPALESAVTAGLLIDVPGTLDRYAFAHALFRQTVYSGLTKARRVALHKRLAEALERRHGSDSRRVAELARHYSRAGRGAAPKALEYCVRAGATALGAFSYEEAIEHYEQALVAIEMAGSGDEELRCEVLLALGEAEWRAGHAEDARETHARAARIARSAADTGALGRAALGFYADGWERFGAPDPDARELVEIALAAQPQDTALRAKLTARLAELVRSDGDGRRAEELGEEAIELADSSGDRAALASALIGRWYAVLRPDALEERRQLVQELLALCETLRDRDLTVQAQTLRVRVAAETGDTEALSAAIAEHAMLADRTKQPANQLHSRAFRATRALLRGRYEEVESLAAEVIELGMLAQSPDALHYSTLELANLHWEQGRLEQVEELLGGLQERNGAPVWSAALALLHCDVGDAAQARAKLEALTENRCAALPFDDNWLGALAFLAATCAELGEVDRSAEIFELLEPYRGRFIVVGAGAVCLGPVSHFLGLLAGVRADWEKAVALWEEAVESSRAAGSEPWLAYSQWRLGLALRARGAPNLGQRAEQLIAESRGTAEKLGMVRTLNLVERIGSQEPMAG